MCDENAECVDTAGSYECTCSSGYTGDGHTCLDIDECLSDPCDESATCTNNNGSFSCHCDNEFLGDGKSCTRKFFKMYNFCVVYSINFNADMTCFVPEDRVYECGVNVSSESECETSGCCYNSSADIECYYPSGKRE